MSKLFKYIANNSLATIISDVKEYNKISKECKDLRRDYIEKRMRLVALVNAEDSLSHNDKKACIIKKIYFVENQISPWKVSTTVAKRFCPEFTPAYSEKYCNCMECPWVHKNHAYNKAMQKYNSAVCKKNAFWEEKFQNVK